MADIPDVIPGETITSEWGNDIRDGVQIGTWEVDGSTEVAGPLSGAVSDMATVTLTIPAHWATWKCGAHATFVINGTSGVVNARIRIDGTDQAVQAVGASTSGSTSNAVGGRRTGMSTTGARPVTFRCLTTASANVTMIYLYARAVRTS